MKTLLFGFFLSLFLLSVYAVGESAQGRGSGTEGPTREAIAKGKVTETLSQMETKALAAERSNHWDEASSSYRQASMAARISGQLQKAVSYGNKAFEMGEKARDPGLQAEAILQLVESLRQVGQRQKAHESLLKGIDIAKNIDSSNRKQLIQATLYGQAGIDFLRLGETRKSIEYISYAVQIHESQLAWLKGRGGKRRAAGKVPKQTEDMLTALDLLGAANDLAGNMGDAIKAYEKGLFWVKESELKTPLEANFYQGLGQVYLGKKDFPRAHEYLKKALEVAEKLQQASVIELANSQIGDLLRQSQKPSEAIPYYKNAIDVIESTRSLLQSEEFRSSFFEDKRETYSGMILAYLDNKNTEEAFNYNERARSRAFLDILGSKVQLARGNLLEEERALQAKISALRARTTAGEDEEEDVAERGRMRRELEEAQKAYNDFLAKVRKENKEQASLMNVEPLTLKEAQQLLEPSVTMLEYFVVGERVLLWVVERDRIRFVSSPISRKELVGKVGALRESVFQLGEKEKFRASAQELYKLLIEPALPHIRGKELLIVSHDVLHYVPFQALISAKGRYLIQDYPVYYLSSASLMQFTREKRRASRETALVMGNPSLGDAAYNLRFAEREAKEIAAAYPKSVLYLKEEATKPKAISSSPNFEMLHFAVHAEFNEEDPLSSALLLAGEGKEDGRLKVAEIFSLNLKADMVVLSACETGLGKISSGDEIIGLTRAFIYAGTPSIVTTLWKVNDRASYELMREFYQHLKAGKKSEALRQAQLKTMQEFPEPFYWAAYQLTGEP